MNTAEAEIPSLIARAAAVLRSEGAVEVFVFGSAARGEMRPGSDIDVAVTGLPRDRYFRALGRALCEVGRSVDVVDLDEDTPFVRYLRSSGEMRRVA